MQRHILILLNRGGWGDGSVDRATEEKTIVQGIVALLIANGFTCELQAHERLHAPNFFSYLKAVWDLCLFYRNASTTLAKELQAMFSADPQLRVLLIGYSLGAVLNIAALKRLPAEPRLYAVQIGAPFFLRSPVHQRVLSLQRKDDAFASGPLLAFFLVLFRTCFVVAANIGTFQGTSILDAWHIKNHQYLWQDPRVQGPLAEFLLREIK